MNLAKVPMKAGGDARRSASLEQGAQVSTATHKAAATTREEGGANCRTYARFGTRNSTTSQSE